MKQLVCTLMVVMAGAGATTHVFAQSQGTMTGVVVDALGARVPGATVILLREGQSVQEARSAADGAFSFSGLAPDRYQVRVSAQGFQPNTSEPVFVGGEGRPTLEIALSIGPLRQEVVVTAAATGQLESRTGAPVTVIDGPTLEAINKLDLFEALRLVPGSHVVQQGQRGSVTSFFLRGGNSNFTKVLVDGVPSNDIGGAFDFSQLAMAGVDRIEVLRQANSVIYGSDALTGVVDISTPRGASRVPLVEYAIDGGNLSTFNNALSIGGAVKRFDYYSQYSYYTTDNSTPNSQYRNGTYAGRFGVALGSGTNLYGTIRHLDGRHGNANGLDLFGIPDDSISDSGQTYMSVAVDSQVTQRWQATVRYGSVDQKGSYTNPAPTGEPFDSFGTINYLGETVTLEGADGRSVTGQAILDYGFGAYPSVFESRTMRRALFGQTTFQATPAFAVSAGGRVEHEAGYDDPDDDPTTTRNNGGGFVEGRAAFANRAYITAGIGVEHNAVFDTAYTPRLSAAVYVRNPSNDDVGETKVTFNIGTGIKAPSVFQAENALSELVPPGSGVTPLGAERSRGLDVGLEQAFASGRLRARVGYFNNAFTDLIEFLGPGGLIQAGVPPEVAFATYGAYFNSLSYDAHGVELGADAMIGMGLRVSGSYTYLDAEVTEALGAGGAEPVYNPAFPNIPIGQYGALVGERPFRRPANSGTLLVSYTGGPVSLALSGYFAGRRDDSTFLSDGFYGYSMLLPNQDLDPAYQKIDLSGAYRVHPRVRLYASIENLFDQDYSAVYGFPSLPFAIRAGATLSVGGSR